MIFNQNYKCIKCHFMHRKYCDEAGREYKMEIDQVKRDKAKANDFSWQKDYESLGCYKGVWDEGHNFNEANKYNLIVKTKRTNCYYWCFQPGTFLNSAEKLYEKQLSEKDSTRKFRLTIYALSLTIIGLIIKIYMP